jgi:signal transduction histidine kinase
VLVTALILFTPYLSFGHHSRSLHLVLDTVDACVAVVAAYLLYGRFWRRRRLQDLLLAYSLLLLAVAGVGVTVVVATVGEEPAGRLDVWVPLALRVTGALLIAAASLVDERPLGWTRARHRIVAGTVAAVLLLGLALVPVGDAAGWSVPVAVDPSVSPASANQPLITGHPLLLAAHALSALCFAVASLAFTRRTEARDDDLLRWMGPACALAAFARLNYLLFPSLYTDWLYTGDLLRTGFYVLLVVGAAREIRAYWSTQAAVAVLEDRRRLASELHDGVMQELAYIRAETRALPIEGAPVERVVGACERAMDEARAAVHALGHGGEDPLGYVLHRSVREMAERYGGEVEADLDDSVTCDPEQQHALVRIAREATSNAVRHGGADRVRLCLRSQGRCRQLVIEDNGHGFDMSAVQASGVGFGMVSMRERARNLPGSLSIESAPGHGAKVTVAW